MNKFAAMPWSETSSNLKQTLRNCVQVFRKIGIIADEYVGAEGNTKPPKWKSVKRNFKEKEVEALSDHLATSKATCAVAVNTAT
jgi:hypothetical protein